MLVTIQDAEGRPLKATIEVEGNAITVHSRSGGGLTARNPDYRRALELILERLSASGAEPDIYLDSRPVAHLPLSERKLASAASLTGTTEERFLMLLHAMNAGSASHGAYRRLRLEVANHSAEQLAQRIGNTS